MKELCETLGRGLQLVRMHKRAVSAVQSNRHPISFEPHGASRLPPHSVLRIVRTWAAPDYPVSEARAACSQDSVLRHSACVWHFYYFLGVTFFWPFLFLFCGSSFLDSFSVVVGIFFERGWSRSGKVTPRDA